MYPIIAIDEFIYNKNNDIALKLSSKTIFSGENRITASKYSYFEIWMLISTNCKFETNKQSFELFEGDILIFFKNDDKEIVLADNNAVFLCLQIDTDAYEEMLPINSLFNKNVFFESYFENFNNIITAESTTALALKELLYKMVNCFNNKVLGYQIDVLRHSLKMLTIIAKNTNFKTDINTSTNLDSSSKNHRSIKKAIDYIDSHLSEELTLNKISAVAELSPNYFSNIFREQTEVRLWDYISEKRIHLATQLLIENPNDSIISVALKCGFNNCPNFNRAFKKYAGQTPKKYKTSILKQEEK